MVGEVGDSVRVWGGGGGGWGQSRARIVAYILTHYYIFPDPDCSLADALVSNPTTYNILVCHREAEVV